METVSPSWPDPSPGEEWRPVVWLNAAMSLDGRIAYSGGKRATLSSPEDLARVDLLRATSDAILIGANTVRLDNPSLRIHWERIERDNLPTKTVQRRLLPPTRVVLVSKGGIPPGSKVLDGSMPTVVFDTVGSTKASANVTIVKAGGKYVDIPWCLKWLKSNGIDRLMVEGGSDVISSFLRAHAVDQATVYVSQVFIGGKNAPTLMGGDECEDGSKVVEMSVKGVLLTSQGMLVTMVPRTKEHVRVPLGE